MILSGKKISEEVKNKKITIEPFDINDINPNSYNYTLDNYVYVYGIVSVKSVILSPVSESGPSKDI